MEEVEVDPELFVKCRLCLDNTGTYVLNPTVQQEIKFCFDIEVGLFDSWSHVICKTCKDTLTQYSNIKTTFIEKQESLKRKLVSKKETNEEEQTVPTLQETEIQRQDDEATNSSDSVSISKSVNNTKLRSKRILSSDSSDEDASKESNKQISHRTKRIRSTSDQEKYVIADYLRQYVCKFCDRRFKTRSAITQHYTKKHTTLTSNHPDVFDKYCVVNLTKAYDDPTCLGDFNAVVHDRTKIIKQEAQVYYYVLYSPKKTSNESSSDEMSTDEDIVMKNSRNKRLRLLSKSSNDTVVLEGESSMMLSDSETNSKRKNAPTVVEECINIDSSDSDSCFIDVKSSSVKPFTPNITDVKKVEKIVSNCTEKHVSKFETNVNQVSATLESQLKSKILNMGTKMINKLGFNCTGLLRYMEHKNLEVSWNPTQHSNNMNKGRITFKLRGIEKEMENAGWTHIPGTEPQVQCKNVGAGSSATHSSGTWKTNSSSIPTTNSSSIPTTNSSSIPKTNSSVLRDMPIIVQTGTLNDIEQSHDSEANQAVLYSGSNESDTNKNKLLNAHPVANPKQLPKKSNQTEICSSAVPFCMPIITSTTSLAEPNTNSKVNEPNSKGATDKNKSQDDTSNVPKSLPRIKVKPVSELMAERPSKTNNDQNTSAANNCWPGYQSNSLAMNRVYFLTPQQNGGVHVYQQGSEAETSRQNVNVTTPAVKTLVPILPKQKEGANNENESREFVILHTAELPNTKCRSPFRYLKKLLSLHNILLLDPNLPEPDGFTGLIKFKLQYSQDTLTPVIFNIKFSCRQSGFYLSVKHGDSDKNMDVEKLSANWQWDILNRINKEEVVNKVLKNAGAIDANSHKCTEKFFCLLKSIELKTS